MSKYQIQEKTSDGMVDIEPVTSASYVTSSAISGKTNVEDALASLSSSVNNVAGTVQNGVVSDVTVSGSGSSGRVNVTKGGTTTALTVPYATKAGSLSNTSAIGSTSVPVYINASGVPTTTGYNLATMTTNITNAQNTADEAKVIAEGKSAAKSYDTYNAMVTAVNAMASTDMKVGDNIYIRTSGVPDMWVSGVNSTKTTYTYSNDAAIAEALNTSAGLNVGYYKLNLLESDKPVLTDYVTKTYTGTIAASTTGNAATATRATNDGNGNNIASTYSTKANTVSNITYNSVSNSILIEKGNGTTSTAVFSDEKVKTSQLSSTDTTSYAVVLVGGLITLNDTTTTAYRDSGISYTPSTTTLTVANLKGNAATATKLATARTLTVAVQSGANSSSNIISGAASQTFDGSASKDFVVTLGDSGITAGTYSAVQVNAKGIAVAGGQMIQIAESTSETVSSNLAVGGLFFKKLD